MPTSQRAVTGGLARAYAAVVVSLRYFIVAGWVAAVAAAVAYLPVLAQSSGVASLVPAGSPAVRAEVTATKLFGEPLDAQAIVVQRAPGGLPTSVQAAAVRNAVNVDAAHRGGGQPSGGLISGLAGALPIPNTNGIFPGSRERSTTVLTYLYFEPSASAAEQLAGSERYASRYASAREDHLVGVTGAGIATYEQGVIISQHLVWVELATVLAIAMIVGFFFLSLGAPVATLACAATAYLLSIRIVAWVLQQAHVTLPPDVEPVLVVLLLGVTTDYSVFFASGMRNRLAEGLTKLEAARLTTAEYAPIILAAGILVAAGTASLAIAKLQLISAFGPALALTVLTAMVVSVTLAPALISIFGTALFWPGPHWFRKARKAARRAARAEARGLAPARPPSRWKVREAIARFAAVRPVALLIIACCTIALLGAALSATGLRLGAPLVTALPVSAQPARAQAAAAKGFAAGIVGPTEVLILGTGVTHDTAELDRLQASLARQPGVAGVVGPATMAKVIASAAAADLSAARVPNPMLAKSGNAARFGIIEQTDPLGATAIDHLQALQRRLPRLVSSAGLTGVRVEVGGETAAAGEAVGATTSSLGELALLMLAITFVLLAIFLRALLAPLYLLAASILALLATLGVTVWVFQDRLGYDGLVYYVPFTVAVLLISLGADYNVFVVGRIWEEARRRPLLDAIAVAGSQASRAITVAGIALAASFALLALIPLQQFREVAVAMAAGIVIDAIIVRSLLVPALVAFFGRLGMWPGSPLRPPQDQRRRLLVAGERQRLQGARERQPSPGALRAGSGSGLAGVVRPETRRVTPGTGDATPAAAPAKRRR
jgi:putative drug exporter of the RND superfamily